MEQTRKPKKLFVKAHKNLINPVHKIEIILVGAGGTGSQMLQGLARMNHALEHLDHPGFHVSVVDPDIVEEPNIGRQLFSYNDIGKYKSDCLVTNINRFYGTAWESYPTKIQDVFNKLLNNSVIITCTDNVDSRKFIAKEMLLPRVNLKIWIDTGNGAKEGQVIMGTYYNKWKPESENQLASIADIGIPDQDDESIPSCSLAQALRSQDLMINSFIANAALAMFWQIFSTLKISYNVTYLNLTKMKMLSTLKFKDEYECQETETDSE